MAKSISPEKLEEFINSYLREDLKELEHHLNIRNGEINEYNQLKNTIKALQQHFNDGMTTQMNIGGNYFIQAKVPKMDRIIINIGKDIYMDFTMEEALTFVDFQLRVLNKEVEVIRDESITKRAEIKLALMCIGAKNKVYPSELAR